jgi:hypothetical protein
VSTSLGWPRRHAARLAALAVLVTVFYLGQLPSVSAGDRARLAEGYAFTPLALAMPHGLSAQTIRPVNQAYDRVEGWVSSVGASIAMGDLTGDGLANDICLTDPRFDQVVVTPAPVAGESRYQPFVLDPSPLPVDDTMAPMGCVPGDFDADGRMDVLAYYWGRTPIIFLAREDATELSAGAFDPVEMVAGVSSGGRYTGPLWNTNAVAISDLDGDGYEDIFVGNFWPHSAVLDDTVSGGVEMPDSLSYALNGGDSYIYRRAEPGAGQRVSYELAEGALSGDVLAGWVLAAVATDLDGDFLPELYIAHDFGLDRLLHNRSTPGNIQFGNVRGDRRPMVPKSKVLGRDSFKGMGVDLGDLNGDGRYDIFVSNITTSFGIQESNFAFVDTASDRADLREQLSAGVAPYEDRSAPLGLAWSGWGWDTKLVDFNNNGQLEVAQTTGFTKGKVNRWPQLQEMAATNDDVISDPEWWPHVREGDDVGGDQTLAFFSRADGGRYVDIGPELGMAVPVPTRGIGVGDANGDGLPEFAVARQWDEPVFYWNESPSGGDFLGLRLTDANGSPVVDAQVTVTTSDGRILLGRVDGGSGHAGKRSHEVLIGLGEVTGPLSAHLRWRDRGGQVHEQDLQLAPGWHSFQLGNRAQEVTS